MYSLTSAERETTINWNMADKTATIDTADPVEIRKLDKLAAQFPETYRCTKIDEPFKAKMYTVPSKYIRYAKPPSPAQRKAAIENSSKSRFSTR